MCPLGKPSQWQTPLQTFTRVHKESILIKAIILSESEQQRGFKSFYPLPWLGPFSALESDDKNELLEFWMMTKGARRCHSGSSSSTATCIFRHNHQGWTCQQASVCVQLLGLPSLSQEYNWTCGDLYWWPNNSLITNSFFLMNRHFIYRLCLQ